ncbi:MAG: zinc-ribbon domain containing protein [Pirellulaceae bacterium]
METQTHGQVEITVTVSATRIRELRRRIGSLLYVLLSVLGIGMEYFGETSSENMPRHFFRDCFHINHKSAMRADVSRQNYSICPRYWYVDATFKCSRCSEAFCFTAAEQKRWYEELGFYVDSYAKNCSACRCNDRQKKLLRQEYDRDIETTLESKDIEAKKRLANVIDELYSCGADLPEKIHANRRVLGQQIARIESENIE